MLRGLRHGPPGQDGDLSATNRIVYRFQDASLPPEHHRSYEIAVDPQTVALTVDRYGEELAAHSWPSNEAAFLRLLRTVAAADLRVEERDRPTKDGATSQSLTLLHDERELLHGWIGGGAERQLTGDAQMVIAAIKALVPDLRSHIDVTYD